MACVYTTKKRKKKKCIEHTKKTLKHNIHSTQHKVEHKNRTKNVELTRLAVGG